MHVENQNSNFHTEKKKLNVLTFNEYYKRTHRWKKYIICKIQVFINP